jgi:hypothetical protein
MGGTECNAILTHLAVAEKVNSSMLNQASSALLFLFRHVKGKEIGDIGNVILARRPVRFQLCQLASGESSFFLVDW